MIYVPGGPNLPSINEVMTSKRIQMKVEVICAEVKLRPQLHGPFDEPFVRTHLVSFHEMIGDAVVNTHSFVRDVDHGFVVGKKYQITVTEIDGA